MDRRSRQAQLCEDRVDVLLYRRLGLNALAVFGAAIYAGRRLRAATAAGVEQP